MNLQRTFEIGKETALSAFTMKWYNRFGLVIRGPRFRRLLGVAYYHDANEWSCSNVMLPETYLAFGFVFVTFVVVFRHKPRYWTSK